MCTASLFNEFYFYFTAVVHYVNRSQGQCGHRNCHRASANRFYFIICSTAGHRHHWLLAAHSVRFLCLCPRGCRQTYMSPVFRLIFILMAVRILDCKPKVRDIVGGQCRSSFWRLTPTNRHSCHTGRHCQPTKQRQNDHQLTGHVSQP